MYEEAVAICREESDPLTLAHTVRHLGDVHQDAGRVELAEPCYDEALVVYRSQEERTHPLRRRLGRLGLGGGGGGGGGGRGDLAFTYHCTNADYATSVYAATVAV